MCEPLQNEVDESDAIVVHLIADGTEDVAFCTGRRYDPGRWTDSKRPRRFCDACRIAAARSMREAGKKTGQNLGANVRP